MTPILITLYIFLIIISLAIGYLIAVFIFDLYLKLNMRFFLKIIKEQELKEVSKKIVFLEKINHEGSEFLNSNKINLIDIYYEIYCPNFSLLKKKFLKLKQINIYNLFNFKKAKNLIDEINTFSMENYVIFEKQDYLLEKINEYKEITSKIFIKVKDQYAIINSLSKKYQNSTIEIQRNLISELISNTEKNQFMMEPEFEKEIISIFENYKLISREINLQATNLTNLDAIKIWLQRFQNFTQYVNKNEMYSFPNMQEDYLEVRNIYNDLINDLSRINIKREFFERMNQIIQDVNIIISREIREKNLISYINHKIKNWPNLIKDKNSKLVNELKQKRIFNYNEIIDNIKNYEEQILLAFNLVQSHIINNENNDKVLNQFNQLFDYLIEYIHLYKTISKKINIANETKQKLNSKLIQINSNLINCESKLRQLPEIHQGEYIPLIKIYNEQFNKFWENYNDNSTLVSEQDYLLISEFLNSVNSFKVDIYTKLFLVSYIESVILFFNNYKNSSLEFYEKLNQIEKIFKNGEITNSLRLLSKLLDLYGV